MTPAVPVVEIHRANGKTRAVEALSRAPRHPLVDVGGAAVARPRTDVALLHDDEGLHVLFVAECEPPLTLAVTQPNGAVFSDECVEVFIAEPGDPTRYLEVVVNPLGAVYTANVSNPDESRATWRVAPRQAPEGFALTVEGEPASSLPSEWTRWTAALRLPWRVLSGSGEPPRPGENRRGNLYRIARGRSTAFEALSPTLRSAPPDFHVPSRFALFVFV